MDRIKLFWVGLLLKKEKEIREVGRGEPDTRSRHANTSVVVCCPEDVDLKLRGQTCQDPDKTQK